jgi:ketosteroid isomerase-like protein
MTSRANITANIAAVQRFWQGFNTHNLDFWDEVCAEDFINHDPGLPTPEANLVTIKQTITQLLFGAFPDLQAIEQDLLVDGDKVVTRRILRGTHQGEFMGVAPTGKKVTFDALGLLHQISAIPI